MPAGLTGALQDDESVDLDWDDSTGADSYQVSYRHAHVSEWTILPSGGASVTITGSSAEVSGLPYPLNYYFRVNASNTDGTSNWSDELLVTPAPIVGTDGCVVAAPPQELAGFAKHCAAGGIGIVGSNEVSDFAIKLAWNHIMNMLAAHPDVHERMAQAKVHHVLKAAATPGSKASYANNTRQAWSDEENLLCYPGEARRLYALYDSFIHEFGHAIHRRGLTTAQYTETEDAYTAAKGAGLWDGTYSNADVVSTLRRLWSSTFPAEQRASGRIGNHWRNTTFASTRFSSSTYPRMIGGPGVPHRKMPQHRRRCPLSPPICGPPP